MCFSLFFYDNTYFICNQKSNINIIYNIDKGFETKAIYVYAPIQCDMIINEDNMSLNEYINMLISQRR